MCIVEGSDKVEAQSEAFGSVAVGADEDGKALEPAKAMFDGHTLGSEPRIVVLLLTGEGFVLALFVGQLAL